MRHRIGLLWAKYLIVIGQVGGILALVNFVMMIGVFYTTTASQYVSFPLYALVILSGVALLLWFVLAIGIKGYYAFFNQQSAMDEINRKVDKLLERLNDDN